jgi:hypothetical protein
MGAATDRLSSLSDEEVRALSPEEYARLDRDAEREESAEERLSDQDPLLFVGPDLNRPLRALQPVDVPPRGNEDPRTMTEADRVLSVARKGSKHSNLLRNMASLPLEYLKVVNSPWETAKHLADVAGGAVKSTYGPAQHHLRGLEGDPDISAFKDFTSQLTGQFSEKERERRPLDPLLTVGSVAAPILRATRLGKIPAFTRTSRALEDPGSAMVGAAARPTFKALAGLTKEGARRGWEGAKKLADTRPGQTAIQFAKDAAYTARMQVLGFSTTTSRRTQRIVDTAPERGESRIVKEFSGPIAESRDPLDKAKLKREDTLVRNTLGAVDAIQEESNKFQTEAKEVLAPHMQTGVEEVALEALKKAAVQNLRKEFNAIVGNEWAVEILEPELSQISSQRATTPSGLFKGAAEDLMAEFPESTQFRETGQGPKQLRARGRTGEADVSFEQFPHPRATQISSEGRGREMVRSFHQRLVNAPPTTVGALQRFMWEIGDAIEITDTEVGKQANRALISLRQEIRKTLSDQLGEPYNAATYKYEVDINILKALETEFGIEPGMISETGVLKGVDRGKVLSTILGSLDDADEFAYELLLKLEKASGVPISSQAAGIATEPMLGKSLIAHSAAVRQTGGLARAVGGTPAMLFTAGSVGAAAGFAFNIPVAVIGMVASAVVFSPKLMQRLVLNLQDPVMKQQAKDLFSKVKSKMVNASRRGIPVSQWVQEGATIEQVLQRLEQIPIEQEQILSPEWEEEFGNAPREGVAPKDSTFMETIGRIDTTPAAR